MNLKTEIEKINKELDKWLKHPMRADLNLGAFNRASLELLIKSSLISISKKTLEATRVEKYEGKWDSVFDFDDAVKLSEDQASSWLEGIE